MEPGSTVCAGSKVERNAVAREGETIPPSTLVVCPRKDFTLAARGRRLAETPNLRGDCGRQCRNATGVELQTCSSDTPLVAIDGTQRPLPIDREVRVHPDDSSRKLPETPPPAPAPAAEAAQRASKRRHDDPSR